MSLTIAYITARKEPKIEWFFDSLKLQIDSPITIIIVDAFFSEDRRRSFWNSGEEVSSSEAIVQYVPPKPTIWQGEHRITREDWWSKSNAMNTAICLCKTDWIAFVDDRSVLCPEWLQCVRHAMEKKYAVCGSYEKRANMKVENGVITDMGVDLGQDTREQHGIPMPTWDWYGGSCALPLEWCLQVNGYPEICDSLGSEDSMFGILLKNNRLPMKFDSRMRIIEDRTPTEIDGALKRADKNPHLGQQAKSWAIVRMFRQATLSQNEFDIRNMRARVLNGEPFPPPTGSRFDFYDGQFIGDMT